MKEIRFQPELLEVVSYFISLQRSTDPVWWGCRWSDMLVYATTLKPNKKSKGCMFPDEYPFNVWDFLKKASKDEFINTGIAQVKKSWTSFL